MATVEIEWTWKVTSPLHCGSGVSRAGVADRLVQKKRAGDRNRPDDPIVPGEAVKGAVRMSAEQLLSWLGEAQDYYGARRDGQDGGDAEAELQARTAEPTRAPLQYVFGSAGDAHFSPATYRPPAGSSAAYRVLSSTKIDAKSGTASDDMLRNTEVVAPGGTLTASLTMHVPSDHEPAATTLAVAAIAATEQIGAKGGIGWGRLSVVSLAVKVDAAVRDAQTLISAARVEALREGLQQKAKPMELRPDQGALGTRLAWYRLDIDIAEPACFPALPDVSNKVETEEAVRASVLRGAWLRVWTRQGLDRLNCVGANTRWLPGLPVSGGDVVVPAARSHMGPKRIVEQVDRRVLYDALRGDDAPLVRNGKPFATRPLDRAWIESTNSRQVLKIDKQTRMLVARHYLTGSHAPAALYARESLVPGRSYRSWACVPEGTWKDREGPVDIFLGKRTSAGNGRATVTVTRSQGPPKAWGRRPLEPDDHEVYLQLITPAIVRGAGGFLRRALTPKDWREKFAPEGVTILGVDFGNPAEGSAMSSAVGRRGGWMSTWKQPRAAVTTIEAGSSWRLRCADEGQATRLREHLSRLQQIGERQHEGFGWLAVDPPWLGLLRMEPPDQQPPDSDANPQMWPGTERHGSMSAHRGGFDEGVHQQLTKIAEELKANFGVGNDEKRNKLLQQLRGSRAALQQLAQRARQATTAEECQALAELCTKQADVRERRGWLAARGQSRHR